MSESPPPDEMVKLYRIENPTILHEPDGVTSHPDLVGQWFTPDLNHAMQYLRKNTQGFGNDGGQPIDGAQLVIASVPASNLPTYQARNHPDAAGMDIEDDNYLIRRDGDIEITTIPLDSVLGELRGHLGKIQHLSEASRRISQLINTIAAEQPITSQSKGSISSAPRVQPESPIDANPHLPPVES